MPNSNALNLLSSNTISLIVTNENTGITANLTEGTLVNGTPTGAGQYYVQLNDADRKTLTVTFYNGFGEARLYAGGSYSAAVTVLNNASYICAETFNRAVTVNPAI